MLLRLLTAAQQPRHCRGRSTCTTPSRLQTRHLAPYPAYQPSCESLHLSPSMTYAHVVAGWTFRAGSSSPCALLEGRGVTTPRCASSTALPTRMIDRSSGSRSNNRRSIQKRCVSGVASSLDRATPPPCERSRSRVDEWRARR